MTDPTHNGRMSPTLRGARQPAPRRNWPLIVGGAVVLLVLFVAIAGPAIAPRNPLHRSAVIKLGDRYYAPPFPPFRSPDYPLGSDQAGRDLFSRLLWGVRPTMFLVTVVVMVRLLLGLALGLTSGWSRGAAGRVVSAVMAGARTVPVLLVALCTISAIGIQRGLLAFIIGLALTGWAETGRLVAEQTRLIREQPYIQAARALGGSGFHLLVRHVLRHIRPLLGMLFAFEVSATLMVTAALGFLGYYIGGGVLVEMDDRVTRTFVDLPELGQMLSTALIRITQPGPMVAIGTTIFVIVLGFNLLGEGLRREAQRTHAPSLVMRTVGRVANRVEEELLVATGRAGRRALLRGASAGLLLLAAWGGWAWWRQRPAATAAVATPIPPTAVPTVVRSTHLWASQWHDAQGTLASQAPRLTPTPGVRWVFEDKQGFSGGPAVAADGSIYVATVGGTLYALGPGGEKRWQATLPAPAVGSPALGGSGAIYVVDRNGGLSAFTPDGRLSWRFQSPTGREATSGPIVHPQGPIYYTLVDRVQAVTPAGQALWVSAVADGYYETPPVLDPTGAYLFLVDTVFDTRDGSRREFPVATGEQARFTPAAYVVGADGQLYHHSGSTLTQWRPTSTGVEQVRTLQAALLGVVPGNLGVTRKQRVWEHIPFGRGGGALAWFDAETESSEHPPIVNLGISQSRVIGLDAQETIYICGTRRQKGTCVALPPKAPKPLWEVTIERQATVTGGALTPGRLYVATAEGAFYAIGD